MAFAKQLRRAFLFALLAVGLLLWLAALLRFSQIAENSDSFAQYWDWILLINTVLVLLVLTGGVVLLVLELRSNANQGKLLADVSSSISYHVEPGPNPDSLPPDAGPYDVRLGYALLPDIQARMQDSGFAITRQSRLSRRHEELVKRGIYYIYREKAQAGLELLDQNNELTHRSEELAEMLAKAQQQLEEIRNVEMANIEFTGNGRISG